MRSRTDGFTLIEVMISLTIMVAITSLAFTGLSTAMESFRRGTKQLEQLDERATVERLLKSQLELAYPTMVRATIEDKPTILFRGSANRIDFVSNYSLSDGPCDFRKIGYLFDGQSFRYEEKSLFGYVFSQDETIQGRSVAAFRSMRFRFLKKHDDGRNTWQDSWNYGEGLPAAVEVHMEGDAILIPLVNGHES